VRGFGRFVARPVRFNLPEEPEQWVATITEFLRRHLEDAGAKGYVVGLSGGLDSAVVAALCVKAVGRGKVLGLIMPAPDSDPKDKRDAMLSVRSLRIKAIERPIGPMLDGVTAVVGNVKERVRGNAKSRSRMVVLYAEAQQRGFLVCGTGNKSELLTGYFTKWGDGGVDVLPIGDLYKTQVRVLARHLGVPAAVIRKPPSAGLHPGQTDEGDMGITYERLDAVLRGLELNMAASTIARKTGEEEKTVLRVEGMVRASEHKRRLPIVPKLAARTVGIDWRRPVHWDA
jgi:NAD+ synthase